MLKKAPEKDRSERYLLTYSDLMNLLLILFIILYTTSKADAAKYAQIANSIRNGFGHAITGSATGWASGSAAGDSSGSSSGSNASSGSSSGSGGMRNYWSSDQQLNTFLDDLLKLLKQNNLLDKVDLTADNRGVVISLRDNVLFTPGSAELSDSAATLIQKIGSLLNNISYTQLIIEGHTDSDTLHSSIYKDNRDLSSERANNVARVLDGVGLNPTKIATIGYGEYRPVAPNDNAADKAKNRRVVITILRQTLSANQEVSAGQIVNASSGISSSVPSGTSSTSASPSNSSAKTSSK